MASTSIAVAAAPNTAYMLVLVNQGPTGTLTSFHLLERLALRLLDEEPDEEHERVIEDAEHEECLPS